ncbi:hypothetical protein HB364_30495 [Pseudoflavitalea sp. X16]|uniref:hypothetical protein n=1 Tax=Paraflavitalea devenefica TaxID=2716334 RepID=UPI00142351E1|nr:hypothetical protein [Paraflavitalea devenefica]NII29448.1 hypothetical protein [Paraflavitalea devenefica]
MKKKYAHIDLSPDLQVFRANYIAATEVEATIGPITCYKVHGRYFIRTKSSLTGKRVKKDKRFQRTMQNAGILALAAKCVTPIYNALTEDWRCHDLFRKLVGVGVKLLHQDQGCAKEAIQQAVHIELTRLGYRTEWPVWELPPNMQQWIEEEQPEMPDSASGAQCGTTNVANIIFYLSFTMLSNDQRPLPTIKK